MDPETTEHPLEQENQLADKLEQLLSSEPAPAATAAEETAPAAATEPAEQARDEAGRFAAAEEAQAAETAAATGEEAPAAEEADGDVQAFLAKHGGDVEKALKAAAEAQKLIGRQGAELGELRKLQEQLTEMRDELTAPKPLPVTDETIGWLDEQVQENPQQAALWALQNDPNGLLYERVMDAWFEIPGQARAASAFERQLEHHYREAQTQAQLEAQAQAQAAFADALETFTAQHPDVAELGPAMLEIAKQAPRVVRLLQSDDPDTKIEVLDYLYTKALGERGRRADTLATAAEQEASEQEQQLRQAKAVATVATASSRQPAADTGGNDSLKASITKALEEGANLDIHSAITGGQ